MPRRRRRGDTVRLDHHRRGGRWRVDIRRCFCALGGQLAQSRRSGGCATEVAQRRRIRFAGPLRQALDAEAKDGPAELWLVLLGHGTFDGHEARFNLAGDDLRPRSSPRCSSLSTAPSSSCAASRRAALSSSLSPPPVASSSPPPRPGRKTISRVSAGTFRRPSPTRGRPRQGRPDLSPGSLAGRGPAHGGLLQGRGPPRHRAFPAR